MALARNHADSYRDPDSFDRPRVVAETGPVMVIAEELHFQALVARMVRDQAKLRELMAEAVDYLCGDAALRAGLLGRREETSFQISSESLAVLREFGDVPPNLQTSGDFSVSVERTRYPFSGYYISIWHGSGRPLHDLTLSAPKQNILEPT